MSLLEHETVLVRRGERSGLPLIIAVHSTTLGQAIGGCRLWHYLDWRHGLDDALRLSEAMTLKCAAAELPFGGGKAVIALPAGTNLSPERRRAVMLDLGDLVDSLGGRYGTGEDVGTTAEDMWVVRERTESAYCLPRVHGGIGEPSEPTAVGVFAALASTCARLFGTESLAGRRCTVIGLGQVGSRLARLLHEAGAELIVTDVDSSKKELAHELSASWTEPHHAISEHTDVLIPAALGGLLTEDAVAALSCRAIVGPANNQLAGERVADLLRERGIVWAPDFVVNAGGAIYAATVDILGGAVEDAVAEVQRIGPRLTRIFDEADALGLTPYAAATRRARERISSARRTGCGR